MTGKLYESYDALLCDLDGVVYQGPKPIPQAIEALNQAQQQGLQIGYVTNNASRAADLVAEHLASLGAPVSTETVFGSIQAGVTLLQQHVAPGASVLVTGSPALAAEVTAAGYQVVKTAAENPSAVIQGFHPDLGWRDLAEASFAIAAGAQWIATNTDLTIPVAAGIAPGNGSLVAAITNATGATPSVAGKPQATLFQLAAQQLGVQRPLVIGDRLDTDILGGNRAEMDTALVLTGVDDLAAAHAAPGQQQPQYVLENLSGLFAPPVPYFQQ